MTDKQREAVITKVKDSLKEYLPTAEVEVIPPLEEKSFPTWVVRVTQTYPDSPPLSYGIELNDAFISLPTVSFNAIAKEFRGVFRSAERRQKELLEGKE